MSNGQAVTLKLSNGKANEAGAQARVHEAKSRAASPVKPLISLTAVLAISAALVGTIFITRLNAEWITFLAGILVAALLAEATRVSRAEWALMRRTAQLSSTKEKLDREARAHRMAEQVINAEKPRLHLIDEVMATMVLFVDAAGRCHYHNRALRDWLRFRPEQIEGRHLNEVLGPKVYQEIASHVRQAQEGHGAKYQRYQTMTDDSVSRLLVTHVPQYGEDGRVTGFFMLTDVVRGTSHPGVAEPAPAAPAGAPHALRPAQHAEPHYEEPHTGMPHIAVAVQDDEASAIVRAIEKNEFRLFSQRIAPLGANPDHAEFHEILVRLMEEEEGLIPPGAFFPLAEEYGLMPHLDRWVVQHVAEWVAMQFQQNIWLEGSVYFINLSDESIRDPGFTDFLEVTLEDYGIPGAALCFEVPALDLVEHGNAVADFVKRVHDCGARVALSGFGRNGAGFDKILGFTPDYLKIDGSTLLSIDSDAAALASVKTISDTGHKVGARTIAEMVESEGVLKRLREIGVDLAQGFGIARPHPLARKANERPAASVPPPGAPSVAAGH